MKKGSLKCLVDKNKLLASVAFSKEPVGGGNWRCRGSDILESLIITVRINATSRTSAANCR